MNYIHTYYVRYWNEIEQSQAQDEGLVMASSYSEAAAQLEEYYGKDNIITLHIDAHDIDGEVIPLDALKELNLDFS